jgi:hypothetical protein
MAKKTQNPEIVLDDAADNGAFIRKGAGDRLPNTGYKKPAFWRIFDPKQEVQLTRTVRVSPILNEEGVQIKFDVTYEGDDEYRTRHFPYEEGEMYRASFMKGNDSFPFVQRYNMPDALEDRLVLVLGFNPKLRDTNIPKTALKYDLADGLSFYFDPVVNDKGQLHLKPVSYTISSKEIGKVGDEVLSWISKRGSMFPEWYIRAKLPEIF